QIEKSRLQHFALPFEVLPRTLRLMPLGPGAQGSRQKGQGNRQQQEGGSRQKQVFHHGRSTVSLEESYGRGQLPASRVKGCVAESDRPQVDRRWRSAFRRPAGCGRSRSRETSVG